MGAKTAIPVDEYLHTSFPGVDCEYRDGEVLERSMPDHLHGVTQILLGAFFAPLRKSLSFSVCSETRMKLREGLYLIPDVAVFWPPPPSAVPDSPPLIAIEILSPDDRMSAVLGKLQEYRHRGVGHVWLVDPYSRRLYTCDTGLTATNLFRVPELGIELGPDQIFD